MFFLFTALMLANNFLIAQTNIPGGEVSGTWTKANSPYLIQGAIMIANDSTLTIEPGVSVIFQGGYKFLVLGRLLAVGTISDTITFTAADTAIGWRGIRFDNTPATNDSSKFFYCKLTYGKANGSGEDANGGAIYFYNFSKTNISNANISKNTALIFGGGIYCSESSPAILNNIISNNSASNSGGGIYCNISSPTIFNNTISKNSTSYDGGGIYCDNSSPTISNNKITNNKITEDSFYYSGGGISCNDYSFPTIFNNTISNNISTGRGGGIYCNYSSPTISYNSISNNSCNYGGGIMCDIFSAPTISKNTISYNSASSYGGGIYLSEGNPTISNNTISHNSASSGGGISSAGNSTISNNNIDNNSASTEGGGIFCSGGCISTISNNTISNNSGQKGGAIYCVGTSNPNFHNTLIWGNSATTSGNQVYLEDESSDPNFYFCDVQGGKAGFGLNTNVFYLGTYSNNINTDPLFVDATSANWSLQSNSPCINAGDTSGTYPSTDIAGNTRICNSRIDIGAYEYQNGECTTEIININNMNRKIAIFPNPTKDVFYLDVPNIDNERISITVTNILGIEILNMINKDITTERFIKEINMNGLPNQIYVVKVEINGQVYLRKVCKMK